MMRSISRSQVLPESANEVLSGLPDIIAPDLDLLIVGFNPSIFSARCGHYYARPGNQFWRLLALAGLTPRRLTPQEDRLLLTLGIGMTDLCPLPTSSINDVPGAAIVAARAMLAAKIDRYAPKIVAFNSKAAFAGYFGYQPERWGLQSQRVGSAASLLFVTPSSSGRANGVGDEREVAYRALGALVRDVRQAAGTDLPEPVARQD